MIRFVCFLLLGTLAACQNNQTSDSDPSAADSTQVLTEFRPSPVDSVSAVDWPYNGKLIKSVQWSDRTGYNILVVSGNPVYTLDDGETRVAEFSARHFTRGQDGLNIILANMDDFLEDCPCDCEMNLLSPDIQIQDLNGDGVAEAWFLYSRNDRCDATPLPTRLALFSGNRQLYIDGYTQRELAPDEKQFKELTVLPQSTLRDEDIVKRMKGMFE